MDPDPDPNFLFDPDPKGVKLKKTTDTNKFSTTSFKMALKHH